MATKQNCSKTLDSQIGKYIIELILFDCFAKAIEKGIDMEQ